MKNYHMTTKVLLRLRRELITVLVLVLAILCSLTVSCGSEPSPAPEPTPPPQIPTKPIPESAPAPEHTAEPTPALTSPTPTPTPSSSPSFKLQTGSTISLGELQTTVGEEINLEIFIDGLTNGLSGFDLVISLSDKAVAEIVDVQLPDFGLPNVNKISSSEVAIRAVDLKDIIPSGKPQALLAMLNIEGIGVGTSAVNIIVNAMDDDDGNPMEPYITSGNIEVR